MTPLRTWIAAKRRYRYLALAVVILLIVGFVVYRIRTAPAPAAVSAVDDFVTALNERDIDGAADITSYPSAASAAITSMFGNLDPTGDAQFSSSAVQLIGLDRNSAFFTLESTWTFPDAKRIPDPRDDRTWKLTSQGTVRELAVGWRVLWDPAVLMSSLTADGSLTYRRTDAAPAQVLTTDGSVLMNEQTVHAIELDPAAMPDPVASTTALAGVINVVAPLVTPEVMQQALAASGGAPTQVVRLRNDDFAVLEDRIRAIPGVRVVGQPALIVGDRRITSPLLDIYRGIWQADRDATAGWEVDLVTPEDTLRQAGYQGPPPPNLRTTLDAHIQLAAEEAVVDSTTPAALVAIRPSTGAIVAAAQNSYSNAADDSVFVDMHSVADLAGALAAAGTADNLDPADVARGLGAGAQFGIDGLDTAIARFHTGNFEVSQFRAVAQGGNMDVTTFGLAMFAASIARGSVPSPSVVFERPTTVYGEIPDLPASVYERLRAAVGPRGLSGTGGTDRWIFGIGQDLAYAVYIDDAEGPQHVDRMLDRFLTGVAAPRE
ncbi:hypothetical protein [Millisia brevis]|uniref:hypothetical protein n=1 Tax=Millisia brevis TaxID=264148 RepID=UPI0008339A47|nr:hypothetical protein [Millisia brevis]